METKKINNLSDIHDKNPFRVPENYFEEFTEKIMTQLPEKEFVAPHKITIWEKVKPWVYMAAMFAGLFFTIQFITRNAQNSAIKPSALINTQTQNDTYWNTVQISEDEFYRYLEDQLIEESYYDYVYEATKGTKQSSEL